MNRNHPLLDPETVVEVSRVAVLSLNKPYVQAMAIKEALSGGWFDTSRGTMSVYVRVVDGEHEGVLVYKDSAGKARANYDPYQQVPDGRCLWELDS